MSTTPFSAARALVHRTAGPRRALAAAALAAGAMTGLANASSPVPAATPWVLMGREGDCVEIEGAQRRRFDDLPPVRSPQEMAAALGAAGVVFTLRALPQVGANAWLVEVPARELSLLFVDRSMCRSVSRGPGR